MQYEVIFKRKDHKPDEVYSYNSLKDAEMHLNHFLDDDSNLYKSISVFDSKVSIILKYLLFDKTGKVMICLYNGDYVKLKPEWCNGPTEAKLIFKVSNIHEDVDTCLIKSINHTGTIGVCEQVGTDMIEVISNSID